MFGTGGPGFIGMLLRGVDPFAVYRCERTLKDAGVVIDRDRLVSHYLVMGQLDTLAKRVTSLGEGASPVEVMQSDLLNSDIASDPRLVNPMGWTLIGTAGGVFLFSVVAAASLVRWPGALKSLDAGTIAISVAGIVLTSLCYAFLGWRYGRKNAAGITMILVLAAFSAAAKAFGLA